MKPLVTRAEKSEFALVLLSHQTRLYRLTEAMMVPLWRWSERRSGYDEEGDHWRTMDYSTWPPSARLANWLGDRLEDVGRASITRRARRRLNRKGLPM